MPKEHEPEGSGKGNAANRRKEFEQACCDYIEEYGFGWVEEFTLNGA